MKKVSKTFIVYFKYNFPLKMKDFSYIVSLYLLKFEHFSTRGQIVYTPPPPPNPSFQVYELP